MCFDFWPILRRGPDVLFGVKNHFWGSGKWDGVQKISPLTGELTGLFAVTLMEMKVEHESLLLAFLLLAYLLKILLASFLPQFWQMLWLSVWKISCIFFVFLIRLLLKGIYLFLLVWCISIVKFDQILKILFPLICAVYLLWLASWAFKMS